MLQLDFSKFPQLETPRLILRKLSLKDAGRILQLRSDERVMQYIDKERATSSAHAEIFITRLLQSLHGNDGITWAISLKEHPGSMIGTIGYWRLIKEHHRAEIGYMLDPVFWRKGIMKEALTEVVDAGFDWLKLHSIEAHINPDNIASGALLVSTGFVKEAHFKEHFFYKDVFRDTAIYSRLQYNKGMSVILPAAYSNIQPDNPVYD